MAAGVESDAFVRPAERSEAWQSPRSFYLFPGTKTARQTPGNGMVDSRAGDRTLLTCRLKHFHYRRLHYLSHRVPWKGIDDEKSRGEFV